MTDSGQQVITQNLSLYPTDRAVLHQVAKDRGLGSVSAAARYIIREWLEAKQFQTMTRALLHAQVAGALTPDEVVEALIRYSGVLA